MIPLTRKMRTAMHHLGRQSYTAYHDYFSVFRKFVVEHDAISAAVLSDCRVLDFGCGYYYPTISLLADDVDEVNGLDIIDSFYSDPLTHQIRNSGPIRGLYQYLAADIYYRYLGWFANEELNPLNVRPDTYDGEKFPYESDSFDIFLSNGVLHLVDNYEQIIKEISRVVSSGGYVNINFRNETSLFGYRTPNCTHPAFDDGAPRPWAHLRDWNPSELGLFGPSDYEAIFETFECEFEDVDIYLSDRSNHLIRYEAELGLPTESPDLFIWEDGAEVTKMVREETGVETEDILLGRSFKIVASH